jgi:sugar transferase EpsL
MGKVSRTASQAAKRAVDLLGASAGLILLSAPLLLIALLVKLTSRGPVLFRHLRPGLDGRPFTLLKFRTMTEAKDTEGKPLPDGLRLTRFGRFLRTWSLDELPELINVLKGDMSWVGPRPLLMEYLPRYSPGQRRRHEVKPGITGWAQVNGRNAITWEQKFALDVWYVDHGSFWLDLWILLLTACRVVRREGISHPGQATMGEFTGSAREGSLPGTAS